VSSRKRLEWLFATNDAWAYRQLLGPRRPRPIRPAVQPGAPAVRPMICADRWRLGRKELLRQLLRQLLVDLDTNARPVCDPGPAQPVLRLPREDSRS